MRRARAGRNTSTRRRAGSSSWLLATALVGALLTATLAAPPASAQAEGGATGQVIPPAGGAPQPGPPLPTPPLQPLVHDVLPTSLPGEQALTALSPDVLPAVAAQNGKSVAELTDLLDRDSTAGLNRDGGLFFVDPPPAAPVDTQPAAAPAAAPFPNSQTFLLHSRGGSNRVLYLDFTGYNLPAGTVWFNGAAYNASPFDLDGSPTTWSQAEHDAIQSIWQRVAEDYAPFEIDVTTEDPGFAAINRSSVLDNVYGGRVVITSSRPADFCAKPDGTPSCGGISQVGVVDNIGTAHDTNQPSWVLPGSLGNSTKSIAEAASHEFGHAMGLSHDGQVGNPTEYYHGHGDWAPIMGVGYDRPVTQWSKGEYANPTNTEDDFAVAVSNGVFLAADDAGATTSPPNALVQNQQFLLGPNDVDTWSYTAPCSGVVTFRAAVAAVSPNLSVELRSYNFGGALLQSDTGQPFSAGTDLEISMGALVTTNVTAGSKYALAVLGLPKGTPSTGWSNYANAGRYSLTASGCAPVNNQLAGALTIGGPYGFSSGNNVNADVEVGEPNPSCGDASTNTSWWNWTAPRNGDITIATTGSNFDTVLAVYTGAAVNALTERACNDDAVAGVNGPSSVTFAVAAGTTYRIQVDGYGGATGNISLQTQGCLGNDDFGCAKTLTSTAAGTGTSTSNSTGYTTEPGLGEPNPSCGDPSTNTAWWNWTAPGTGSFAIDTFGSSFDTVLAVYTGSLVPNTLSQRVCNDDATVSGQVVPASAVNLSAVAGTTYRIQVDGYAGATGNITLNVTDNRPVLQPGSYGTLEGDTGSKIFNVPVRLSAPATQVVTVSYAPFVSPTTAGWATANVDFTPVTAGTLTFQPGETVKTIPVRVFGDKVKEPPLYLGEWFAIRFTNPSANARLDTSFYGLGVGIIGDEATDR